MLREIGSRLRKYLGMGKRGMRIEWVDPRLKELLKMKEEREKDER